MSSMSFNCSVCGGILGRELLVITQPDRFERHAGVSERGYRRVWVECPECGTATDILPPGPNRLADIEKAYYAVDFQNSSIPEKFKKIMSLPGGHSDNAIRVDRILDFLDNWQPLSCTNLRRALDIGSGLGVFPARFLDRCGGGWSMTAVEPDPMAAAHLASLNRFEVAHDGFPMRENPGQFHLVTLNKVVEHIGSPVEYLRAVAMVLDPASGVAYIEVPDKATIHARPSSDNILGALHRHLYDLKGLLRLLTEAGLVAMRLERILEPSGKLSVFAFATLPVVAARLSAVRP